MEEVKFDFSKPGNSFELERDWRSIKSLSGKARYLRIDESDRLAALFAPQLPKFLVEICSALLYSIRKSWNFWLFFSRNLICSKLIGFMSGYRFNGGFSFKIFISTNLRNSDEKEAIRYCETFLRSISSLPRFQTALFFLMDEERRVISDLFEILKSRGSSSDLARLYHVWNARANYFLYWNYFYWHRFFLQSWSQNWRYLIPEIGSNEWFCFKRERLKNDEDSIWPLG